jgi:hypothetical protein
MKSSMTVNIDMGFLIKCHLHVSFLFSCKMMCYIYIYIYIYIYRVSPCTHFVGVMFPDVPFSETCTHFHISCNLGSDPIIFS